MAKLPSAESLGNLPSAASGRQMSAIDASPIGQGMMQVSRGMMALAQGQQALGEGIASGVTQLAQSFKVDDDLADAQTRADFLSEKIKLDSERDQEVDAAKLGSYPQRYQGLVQQFAQKYADPRRRQKFLIETQDDIARATAQTSNRKVTMERNIALGQGIEQLQGIKRNALEAKDEADKSRLIAEGTAIIDGMARNGLITPAQAAADKQKWVKDYVISDYRMRSPEDRMVAARGNTGALMVRESGGNPRAENDTGFVGLFQFGAPRLQTLGVYTPGGREDLGNWNSSAATAPGKWSGTFNIPGFPNVKSKADFLANPDAQERVYQIHQEKISQEIKANGLDKYVGQTVAGVKITEDGIRNMIHLGGVGGADAFLRSGGVIDRADKNGTKLSDYARMGSGSTASRMLSFLDPDERMQLEREATRDLMQKAHVAEQEQGQAAAQANAERVARNNELEVGILDGVYGPAEVMRRREAGDLTDADQIRKIDGLLRDQEKRIVSERAAVDILEGRTTANPYDPAAQDIAEAAEKAIVRGSNGAITPAQASLVVFDKFGGRILTKTGAAAIRGGIESPDAEEVQRSVAVASQMMQRNPLIFNSVQGGDKIEKAANLFTHLIDNRNMNPVQAAQRVVEMQRPEYKKTIRLDEVQEKSMMDDLRKNAFKDMAKASMPGSSMFWSNRFGKPEQGLEAAMTYAEEVIDHYREFGDIESAKSHALKSMEKFYGVSNGVLMKFPPEKVYPPDSKGSHEWLYKQAAQDIKARFGEDVDIRDIVLGPVRVETGEAWRAGRPAPYQIMWTKTVNGQKIPHTTPLGTGFVGDFNRWRSENEKPVEEQFNALRAGTQPPPVTVNPRSWKPGRPMKSQDEIAQETMAAQAERDQQRSDLREAGTRGQAGGTGTAAERNKRIREGIAEKQAGETKPRLPVVTDWIESTPPLRDAMPKIQLGPRSRLPGKKDQ